MQLASRFSRGSTVARADRALSNDEIRAAAPSIFADAAHESRSARYTYIPTIDVLDGLRREGFAPFMACQTRVRSEGKREHTKHMLRLRHAEQITGKEANEIILLNSHMARAAIKCLPECSALCVKTGWCAGKYRAIFASATMGTWSGR